MTFIVECDRYVVRPGPNGRLALELHGVSHTSQAVGTVGKDIPRLTVSDVAAMFNVKWPTVVRWVRAKKNPLPSYLIGRRRMFDEVEVREWARKGEGASARHAQSRINLLKPRF